MEEITFTHTVSCRKCKGKRYPERYNDSQSPCYHCQSIEISKRITSKAMPRLDSEERQKRDFKIMELRTSGKTYGEIAHALNMPRATVQSVVKKYEQKQ